MSYDWGPYYIVPSQILKVYSGSVHNTRVTNPWYYRRKNSETWIRIGESDNIHENFPVRWNTTYLEDGQYEILGLMHVFVGKGNEETAIARENVVEVSVKN